jgi:hypothetical protein
MKNKLSDLHNHLFAELERLGDEELTGEKLKEESMRSQAISDIATVIVANGNLMYRAHMADVEWESISKKKFPLILTD